MSQDCDAPPVVVAGWIGSTNLGDELIASVLIRRLQDRGYAPVAPSLDPEHTRQAFGIEAIPHRSLLANRRAIRGAKALIFGGGSLIQDMTSQLNLPYHLSRPWYASRAKVGFGAVGLDAGPLASKWGRRLARRVLARASVVGVRNVESADLLRSIGVDRVVKTADLALACEVRDTPLSDRIAVCLRPPVNGGIRPVDGRAEIQDAEWIQRAARALDQLSGSTGLDIHFVAMQTDRDRVVHEAVHAVMKSEATHADPTLETVLETIAATRLVVAMRYHGGVAAVIGGRPAVMLGYASKVDSLVRQVGKGFVGLGADQDALDSIPDAAISVMGRSEEVVESRYRLQMIEARNEDVLDQVVSYR